MTLKTLEKFTAGNFPSAHLPHHLLQLCRRNLRPIQTLSGNGFEKFIKNSMIKQAQIEGLQVNQTAFFQPQQIGCKMLIRAGRQTLQPTDGGR